MPPCEGQGNLLEPNHGPGPRFEYGVFGGACGNLLEAGTPNFCLGEDPRVQTAHSTAGGGSRKATQPVSTHVAGPDTSDHRRIRGWPGLPPTRNPVQHLAAQRSPAATPRRCPCSRALIRASTRSSAAATDVRAGADREPGGGGSRARILQRSDARWITSRRMKIAGVDCRIMGFR
jgi:hypothetical protein